MSSLAAKAEELAQIEADAAVGRLVRMALPMLASRLTETLKNNTMLHELISRGIDGLDRQLNGGGGDDGRDADGAPVTLSVAKALIEAGVDPTTAFEALDAFDIRQDSWATTVWQFRSVSAASELPLNAPVSERILAEQVRIWKKDIVLSYEPSDDGGERALVGLQAALLYASVDRLNLKHPEVEAWEALIRVLAQRWMPETQAAQSAAQSVEPEPVAEPKGAKAPAQAEDFGNWGEPVIDDEPSDPNDPFAP